MFDFLLSVVCCSPRARRGLLALVLGLAPLVPALAQQNLPATQVPIDPETITIARDSFGTPTIFAPTDAAAAYGLAWANCEDDFSSLQDMLLLARGRLGEVLGPDGAAADYFGQWLRARQQAAREYPQLSQDYRAYLEGYVAGLNAYAQAHPEKHKLDNLLPVEPVDISTGYVIVLAGMLGVADALKAVMDGKPDDYIFNPGATGMGSNAFAIAPHKSTDGRTHLVINPHVPMQGLASFYQAHIYSEQGLEFHGVVVPGTPAFGMGVNRNLGWAMTFNWPKFTDIYRLELNPRNKHQYRFNGEWVDFEREKIKLKAKLGFLKLGVRKEALWTHYGPAFRHKGEVYAFRYPQNLPSRAGQQWYEMSRAQTSEQFQQALALRSIPLFNVVYADRHGNIRYLFNGLLPKRDPYFDWSRALPGDTSATLWTEYYPLDFNPEVKNPQSGYVYNTNNTPFHVTEGPENPQASNYPAYLHMHWNRENNRDLRFRELITRYDKLGAEELRAIKFNPDYPQQHPEAGVYSFRKALKKIDRSRYPRLADAIRLLENWDYRGGKQNSGAALALLTFYRVFEKQHAGFVQIEGGMEVPPKVLIKALRRARRKLLRHHGRLDPPLGQVQRHQRPGVDLPIAGLPETLRAMYASEIKGGRLKVNIGDTYIGFAEFGPEGLQRYETLMPYGPSTDPQDPASTSYMEAFANQKPQPVPLTAEQAQKRAVELYSPKSITAK